MLQFRLWLELVTDREKEARITKSLDSSGNRPGADSLEKGSRSAPPPPQPMMKKKMKKL